MLQEKVLLKCDVWKRREEIAFNRTDQSHDELNSQYNTIIKRPKS